VEKRERHAPEADAPKCEGGGSLGLIAHNEEEKTTYDMVINLLAWLTVGAVAGWLASRLAQGVGMGVIGDIIVGIVGVLIVGFVLSLLAPGAFGLISFNVTSLVIAFIGAVILFFVLKLFTGRRPVS
jgi:uncharacterized membrane protein YeaQ/YmgE (transglycosylase-associated protein family)